MTRTHLGGGVGLVEHDDISALEIDVARIVRGLVTSTVGVRHTDPQPCFAQRISRSSAWLLIALD